MSGVAAVVGVTIFMLGLSIGFFLGYRLAEWALLER